MITSNSRQSKKISDLRFPSAKFFFIGSHPVFFKDDVVIYFWCLKWRYLSGVLTSLFVSFRHMFMYINETDTMQGSFTVQVSNLREADSSRSSWEFQASNHSVAGFQFIIKAAIYQTILINYFPTILMVVIAIFSFLMPFSIIPTRISTITTPLLALLNFLGVITANSPKGRGNTAVGIWIVFCILFGFICFVLQLVLMKFKKDRAFRRKINMAFLVFMSTFFTLFNIFYWSTYLGDLNP